MTYHTLKEVVGVEAHLLPCQYTSYLSLKFVRIFAALIVSYVRSSLKPS